MNSHQTVIKLCENKLQLHENKVIYPAEHHTLLVLPFLGSFALKLTVRHGESAEAESEADLVEL